MKNHDSVEGGIKPQSINQLKSDCNVYIVFLFSKKTNLGTKSIILIPKEEACMLNIHLVITIQSHVLSLLKL